MVALKKILVLSSIFSIVFSVDRPYQERACAAFGGTCQLFDKCNNTLLVGKCPTQPAYVRCCLTSKKSDLGSNGSKLSPDQKQRANSIAIAIMSEASIGNRDEQIAIGFASQRNSKHAKNQKPSKAVQQLAEEIVSGKIPDNTQGADHWYSPASMPKEGENTNGFDVAGGLEKVEGISKRNFRPGWAQKFKEIKIPGVRPNLFKFYKRN